MSLDVLSYRIVNNNSIIQSSSPVRSIIQYSHGIKKLSFTFYFLKWPATSGKITTTKLDWSKSYTKKQILFF